VVEAIAANLAFGEADIFEMRDTYWFGEFQPAALPEGCIRLILELELVACLE
jgi:hypothetical protein